MRHPNLAVLQLNQGNLHVSPNLLNIVFSVAFVARGAEPSAGVRSSEGSLLNTPNRPFVSLRKLSGAATVIDNWDSFNATVMVNPGSTNRLHLNLNQTLNLAE